MHAGAGDWDERVPRLDLDPYDDAALMQPYAMQATLRDAGPVVWLTKYACYAVARYAVVSRVIQDPSQFSWAAGVGLANLKKPGAWRAQSPLVESDPPQHTEFIHRIQSIELAGEPTWQAINALRTLDRLPFKITLN